MASDDTDDFEANVISYNSTMSSFARSFRWDTATIGWGPRELARVQLRYGCG